MPTSPNSPESRPPIHNAYDLQVERAFLGACMVDTRRPRSWPNLEPEAFSLDRHGVLWRVMLDMGEDGTKFDAGLLAHELAARDQLDYCGGPEYLSQCMDEGLCADIKRHEQAIRTRVRKEFVQALAAQLVLDPSDETALDRLLDRPDGRSTRITLLEAWQEKPAPPIMTGITALDEMTGGLRPGTVTVLGARTSHGKSTLAANIAYRVACNGRAVEFLELEETPYRMSQRMSRLIGGPTELLESELFALNVVVNRIDGVWSESAVEAAIRTSEADLIILDHIQQIPTPRAWNRTYGLEQLLSRIHRAGVASMKALLVCAQLNRQVEERRGEPTLGDLRDSGALEQIPRLVLLGYWPSKHDEHRDPNDYILNVAKNSQGQTGRLVLRWNAARGEFLS